MLRSNIYLGLTESDFFMRDLESLHGFSCGPLKDGLDVLTLPQLQNQLMIFLYVQNRQVSHLRCG